METFPNNWGRWGEDDQLGAVNLITAEARARGAAEARTGRTVSLARVTPIAPLTGGPMLTSMGAASTGVQTIMMFTGDAPMAMAEVMIVTTHHPEITHLDGLSHMVADGQVYPGIARADSSGPTGVRHGSADAFGDGILTRGVLLDLAPGGTLPDHHPVTADDLDAAAVRGGVDVRSGDALIVRAGWDRATAGDRNLPGMTSGAVRWMHDHGISLYGGDIGDARPPIPGDVPGALHRLALTRLAIPLLDGVRAEELAAVCAELGRYTFMLVVAVPRIAGTTGLPVNPIAVF
ncbi:kynurenine formamidase [Catenuloplanes nepalensis]|uniref:Kynurenine formamidase n=1 Tax=Catenuloplanes nepalensis TaxID=587533 RepID=A0ABT9MPN5_9ACTN|nr:cyclase family protein [Catenuloplanes nepalensis]MDP9793388.1 kynurenine formamidase [Catenuloplanes nepalensis]